ncbi:SMP-30 gluconolaconase LRE domain protein [Acarospora aff. strigata]|nr:SMP-30 gluconolaconase LRE domain protein [Acarospora aff. strigata]
MDRGGLAEEVQHCGLGINGSINGRKCQGTRRHPQKLSRRPSCASLPISPVSDASDSPSISFYYYGSIIFKHCRRLGPSYCARDIVGFAALELKWDNHLTLTTLTTLTFIKHFELAVNTTTFTVSDRTTTFIGTSTIDLDAINNSTASTSATISGTSSTRTTSSDITSQSSHNTISTSSSDSSSRTVTESSSIGSSSTGTATGAAGLGGATGSPGGSTPTGGVSDGGSDTGNSTAPPTPTVVGSVVGGVAGLALIAILLLLLLRWHRRRKRPIRPAAGDDSEIVPPGTAQSGAMTQRSSNVPLAGAAIAPGFFKRLRPQSVQTTATTETAPSERGFQNLGGRKLPSVFTAGRDGYGGGYDKDTMSGSSFYRDSQGFYGGPGSPTAPAFAGPSSGPSGHGLSPVTDVRDKEVAVMRPSPARTPVTSAGGFEGLPSPPRAPSTPRGTPPPAIGTYPRDAIGRSRPSFNGSRGSKFTEEPI